MALAFFSVGVLRIFRMLWILRIFRILRVQGVQSVSVHPLDDSTVCRGADHDVISFYICRIFYIDYISVMIDRFHAVAASQLRCGTVFLCS